MHRHEIAIARASEREKRVNLTYSRNARLLATVRCTAQGATVFHRVQRTRLRNGRPRSCRAGVQREPSRHYVVGPACCYSKLRPPTLGAAGVGHDDMCRRVATCVDGNMRAGAVGGRHICSAQYPGPMGPPRNKLSVSPSAPASAPRIEKSAATIMSQYASPCD